MFAVSAETNWEVRELDVEIVVLYAYVLEDLSVVMTPWVETTNMTIIPPVVTKLG